MSSEHKSVSFERALRIAGYNWPLYVGAAIAIVVSLILLCMPNVPTPVRWLGSVGALIAVWYATASFFAFHWMFDRSGLLGGKWLSEITTAPCRCAQINAGLEETTLALHS